MLWVSRLRSHEKECPTYLKTIGNSKALAAALSDTEPEDDSNSEDDRIWNAFIANVNPTEGIDKEVDDEEDDIHTTYEKLCKVSEKYEKLYWLATKKLSDVELD